MSWCSGCEQLSSAVAAPVMAETLIKFLRSISKVGRRQSAVASHYEPEVEAFIFQCMLLSLVILPIENRQSAINNQKWHVVQSTDAFFCSWQLRQKPMVMSTVRTATVRCRMSPWHVAHSTPARMCGA